MTRTMYDGVTVSRLPTGAQLYAGYVDGRYANITALRQRFPHARIVEIAVFATTNAGVVLDVEPGDATPAQAVGWVRRARARGVDPTVYCNSSTWPAVKAAFANAGVTPPHYWIAQYDGKAVIPAGAVAKQFKNTAGWDESVVADFWPGIDPDPEDDMALSADDKKWLAAEIAAQIKAALPAIAKAVAETDGIYPAPEGVATEKTNPHWKLSSILADIQNRLRTQKGTS